MVVLLKISNPLARSPLFVRIFVLMLAGVLLAQVLNFLLLLAAPMPAPSQHMLAGVAESLRSGIAAPGFEMSTTSTPPSQCRPEGPVARQPAMADRGAGSG